MKGLENTLKKLFASNYMTASLGKDCLKNVKLLENGKSVAKNLFTEWLNIKESSKGNYILDANYLNGASLTNLGKLFPAALTLKEGNSPLVIKQRIDGYDGPSYKDNFLMFASKKDQAKLVSDYIINSSKMLESFYYIQRQRKLWWMRFSENPSGFYIDSSAENQNGFSPTITIKTRLPFASMSVEEIAYIPLKDDVNFPTNFILLDKGSQRIQPSIIRSTIHLETAICALLLEACINSPHGTISLNRKLVPSQCALLCQGNEILGDVRSELEYLRSHISDIMTSARIRIFTKEKIPTSNCKLQLEAYLSSFDKIGVPYVIIVEERSLHDGLLKLRNRDTLLQETIHISDLPMYILQLINFGPVR